MHPDIKLRLTGTQHDHLRRHLFPRDGNEAVALALCGRRSGDKHHILAIHRVVPVPYEQCSVRTPDRVTWSTEALLPLLEEAGRRGMAILKVHSHPRGFPRFSEYDDESDGDLFPSVYGWVGGDLPHASAVMLPDGRMFGRSVGPDGEFAPLSGIAVAGDDLRFWYPTDLLEATPEFTRRHAQAFGKGTTAMLRRLSVAVIGCSGTGSPVVEMLARLGVGELVLVDPDRIEEKNLNRILHATREDALRGAAKVEVLARAVAEMGLGTRVAPLARSLFEPAVVERVAECDVVFGCVDSVDGRALLNRLATFYSIPYFDVGIRLDADGQGGVDQICGTVHYMQPDGSSLLSRGLYTPEQLQAAGLMRTDPDAYREQLRSKYIVGIQEDRPAVISVNMQVASMAVNELLARLHPYRDDGNTEFAAFGVSLTQGRLIVAPDGAPCPVLARHAGRGDARPLLGLPELSQLQAIA
jgi:hypothetical protein